MGFSSLFENIEERKQANIAESEKSRRRANEPVSKVHRKKPRRAVKPKTNAETSKSQAKPDDEKWKLIAELGNERKKTETLSSINQTLTKENIGLKNKYEAQEIKVAATLLRLDDTDAKLHSLREELRSCHKEIAQMNSENRRVAGDLTATKELLRKLEGRLDWTLEVGNVRTNRR